MIVTVSDESDYLLNVTKYMVISLAKFMPNENLFLVIVNGNHKYDEEVKKWHPKIHILHYELKLENKNGFYFSFMALPLFDLMSKFDEPLVYIDGDVIVRSSLTPLFEELNEHDVLIRYRPFCDVQGPMGTKFGGRVNSGVLALANRPQVLDFVAEFKERIITFINEGNEVISWNKERTALTGIDQELLWVLIMEYKDKLNFFPLNDKYNDSYFKLDSTIWHAKGSARRSSIYLKECYKLDKKYIKFFYNLLFSVYRVSKNFIKSFLVDPPESFRIKEIENILLIESIDSIVIVNSSFYIENKDILKNKNIICYDIDPVVYYNNKFYLDGMSHHFIVRDNEIVNSTGEVDLLIYEESLEYIVSNVKAKNLVVKNGKI